MLYVLRPLVRRFNSGLAKVAVQCSAVRQLAEVNQTFVLCINICSKNRRLLVAATRELSQ